MREKGGAERQDETRGSSGPSEHRPGASEGHPDALSAERHPIVAGAGFPNVEIGRREGRLGEPRSRLEQVAILPGAKAQHMATCPRNPLEEAVAQEPQPWPSRAVRLETARGTEGFDAGDGPLRSRREITHRLQGRQREPDLIQFPERLRPLKRSTFA